MVKACRGVAEEFMKSRDRWKEAGTFVPARMKKEKYLIESIWLSMVYTIIGKCEYSVMTI